MKQDAVKFEVNKESMSKRFKQVGNTLKALRSRRISKIGKKMPVWEAALLSGIKAETLGNAERGKFTMTTLITLLQFYKAESVLDVFSVLESDKEDALSNIIIEKLENVGEGLTAKEFEKVIRANPDREYRVTHRGYLDLGSKYPTRFEFTQHNNFHYATSFQFLATQTGKLAEKWA
jgi:hypothetical protein